MTYINNVFDRRVFLKAILAAATVQATGVGCGTSASRRFAAHNVLVGDTPAPYLPPDGKIYLIAGQDDAGIGGLGRSSGYLDNVKTRPSGVTIYVGFPKDPNEDARGDKDEFEFIQAHQAAGNLENALLHLSVQWVHEGQSTAEREQAQKDLVDGKYDWFIDRLAAFLMDYGQPVLLRPGYEFDRPVEFYNADYFIDAYRRIVDRLRAAGVDNVAYVWASANIGGLTFSDELFVDTWSFEDWYPGDDYVDWFGFSQWFPNDYDSIMMDKAREKNKPVFITESTPVEIDVSGLLRTPIFSNNATELEPDLLWDAWFEPMFEFVETNADVIRAYHYIAIDWKRDELWKDFFLFQNSDARIWANDVILDRWLTRISTTPWVR